VNGRRGGEDLAVLIERSADLKRDLVSGMMSSYRKSDGGCLAKVALELAMKRPELVFRNPEMIEQGWRQMREDRAASGAPRAGLWPWGGPARRARAVPAAPCR
jgi:hypothetical protein